MNIFVVDQNPLKAARALCDRHVVKMIVESAQMLVNPFTLTRVEMAVKTQKGTNYKPSYPNHPCSKWACASSANYRWLLDHAYTLCVEYSVRYRKTHYCQAAILWCWHNLDKVRFPETDLMPFALAMPDSYKSDDAVESYRNYYRNEKAAMAQWNRIPSRKPQWMN